MEKYKNYINNDTKFDNITMISIVCLVVVIAGLFGFIYEFIFYYFNSGMQQIYYRGGNFLPWINIYAIGALMIYFLTYKDRKNPLKVFLKSTIICGVLEFVAGYVMYNFFGGFRCWDYNTEILNFGNIGGFICLRSVLFFGISSLLLIYGIIPFCYFVSKNVDKKTFCRISICICALILFDEFYNLFFARLLYLPRASDIYKQIGIHYMQFK